MRLFVSITLALTSLALLLAPNAFAEPPTPFPNVVSWAEASAASSSDVQLVRVTNDIWVERLRGVAALAHLSNLKSKRPEAFAHSGKTLRERGFAPTNHVYVERTIRLTSNDERNSDIRLAETYSEQNAEGEIVLVSWTDGDDSTWEGEIYMEVYSPSDASIWEGQIDASDSEHAWIYHTLAWEDPDGPLQQDVSNPHFETAPNHNAVHAVLTPQRQDLRNQYRLADWIGWSKCWRKNVVGGCTGGAVACIATNGGWGACWGASCTGVLIAAGIGCM